MLPQIAGVALVPVSAITGEGIDRLMQAVLDAYELWNRRVLDRRAEPLARALVQAPPAAGGRGAPLKLRYLTQAKARPPTFVAFARRPEALPDAWRRYLVNALRVRISSWPACPSALTLRKGDNPYEPGASAADLSRLQGEEPDRLVRSGRYRTASPCLGATGREHAHDARAELGHLFRLRQRLRVFARDRLGAHVRPQRRRD